MVASFATSSHRRTPTLPGTKRLEDRCAPTLAPLAPKRHRPCCSSPCSRGARLFIVPEEANSPTCFLANQRHEFSDGYKNLWLVIRLAITMRVRKSDNFVYKFRPKA